MKIIIRSVILLNLLLPAAFAYALNADSTYSNEVIRWNLITVKASKLAKQNSNLGSRTEAIEAIAVYDAINSIKQFGKPYHYFVKPAGPASAQAAAAQAAHDVLAGLFPGQRPVLDSLLSISLKDIKDGPVAAGTAVGSASATAILALRANDGSSPLTTYTGPEKPGIGAYRPTPGKFAPGVDVEWGRVKPFLLKSNSQFLPETPPAIGSDAYKKAIAEVAELGEAKSSKRTPDQTHIAQFYKQDAELTVNEGARILTAAYKTSLEKTALIFALVDIAEADARIEIWVGKYQYLAWRPVTALNAEADGSVKDYSKWTPLINTPPHPSYPSGHSATITAGYEVLKKFFGDKNHVELHTTTEGEPARVTESLSTIEWENGYSRIYGGIHYAFENTSAQNVGKKIAAYTLANGPRFN